MQNPHLINFTVKTFTSNKFDKLFIPKHQKALQNLIIFLFLFLIFVIYGVFLAALYGELKAVQLTVLISKIINWLYLAEILLMLLLCFTKWIVDKKKEGRRIKLKEQFLYILLFSTILLNILVYAMRLWDIINSDVKSKQEFISSMVSVIIIYFGIIYILLKCHQYLLGFNKKKWVYVLSPIPIDINQKYLEVLYSLTPTQLVLVEKTDDPRDPKSVYLYDLTKNTFTYFQKVIHLIK